jgi:hypothetical protein
MNHTTPSRFACLCVFALAHFALLFPFVLSAGFEDPYNYSVEGDEVHIHNVETSVSGALIVPDKIEGYSVTVINDNAFGQCSALTSVTLPDSIKYIGNSAFQMCSSLATINIPNNVTNIGEFAFSLCVSLTDITIPSSVTFIGEQAFVACHSLTNITVAASNTTYADINGTLCDKSLVTLLACPNGLTGTYTIPADVTRIGNSAFYGCTSLTAVVVHSGVTSIGDEAFAECFSLTSVLFKGNVPTEVGNEVFYDTPATVYYLPGASGWDDIFCERPTAIWNAAFSTTAPPQIDATGAFTFNLTGNEGIPVCIEACNDLATQNWIILTNTTMSSSETFDFTDPDAATYPTRFYRFTFP